eukprot:gene12448-14402_t
MKDSRDVDLVEEAIKWGATRDHLSSQFSAALFLDTFRAQGHYVCTKPAWITNNGFMFLFASMGATNVGEGRVNHRVI